MLERLSVASQGKVLRMTREALSQVTRGERVHFFVIYCGCMLLTQSVRKLGMIAPDGLDREFPLGSHTWNLALPHDRQLCLALQDEIDALVTHLAPECTQLCQHTAARNAERQEEPEVLAARSQVEFIIACIRRGEQAGAAGSMENPVGSSAWGLARVTEYFGDVRTKSVKPGRYVARLIYANLGLKSQGAGRTSIGKRK